MRSLIFIGAIVSAWPWLTGAATDNVRDCESYLIAPKGYKTHTRELLTTNVATQILREQQLRTFVTSTPVGDENVIRYLQALRQDARKFEGADDKLIGFAEFLMNTYLIRIGNEFLALPILPQFLETYWTEFMYGPEDTSQKDRAQLGFAWTEVQTQFIQRLNRDYPQEVRAAWRAALEKDLPQMLNMENVQANFTSAENYLKYYLSQNASQIVEDDERFERRDNIGNVFENRERLHYVRDLIAEMEAPISSLDPEGSLRFYKIGDNPFPGNGAFIRDGEKWRGRNVVFTAPAHLLVYHLRLARRLGLNTPAIETLQETIARIKDGLRDYPRPIATRL